MARSWPIERCAWVCSSLFIVNFFIWPKEYKCLSGTVRPTTTCPDPYATASSLRASRAAWQSRTGNTILAALDCRGAARLAMTACLQKGQSRCQLVSVQGLPFGCSDDLDQFLPHRRIRKAPAIEHPCVRWLKTCFERSPGRSGGSLARRVRQTLGPMSRHRTCGPFCPARLLYWASAGAHPNRP